MAGRLSRSSARGDADHVPPAKRLDGAEKGSFPSSSESHKPMFMPDAEAMKHQVRQNLYKEDYDVQIYYKKTGLWQRIARHPWFERVTLCIIAFNAIWIAVDTDGNNADVLLDAKPIFQIMEHCFCTYFTFELTARFLSFKDKRNCFQDGWFVFDSFLVITMVLETWVMTSIMILAGGVAGGGLSNASILRVARLLRLSRMARMVRLFRAMPELLILIKGMVQATRSVFFTLCLLFIILYVFGIAFRQLANGTPLQEAYFPTVTASMYLLLIDAVVMDNLGEVARDLSDESPVCAILWWVCVLLSSFTVMNMLIGVLCEVVSAVAVTEKESIQVSCVMEQMRELFKTLDDDNDNLISKSEFLKILEKPKAAILLAEVGVDVLSLVDQISNIFIEDELGEEEEERELTFRELMDVILELRSSNTATYKHIVELRQKMTEAFRETNITMRRLEFSIARVGGEDVEAVTHTRTEGPQRGRRGAPRRSTGKKYDRSDSGPPKATTRSRTAPAEKDTGRELRFRASMDSTKSYVSEASSDYSPPPPPLSPLSSPPGTVTQAAEVKVQPISMESHGSSPKANQQQIQKFSMATPVQQSFAMATPATAVTQKSDSLWDDYHFDNPYIKPPNFAVTDNSAKNGPRPPAGKPPDFAGTMAVTFDFQSLTDHLENIAQLMWDDILSDLLGGFSLSGEADTSDVRKPVGLSGLDEVDDLRQKLTSALERVMRVAELRKMQPGVRTFRVLRQMSPGSLHERTNNNAQPLGIRDWGSPPPPPTTAPPTFKKPAFRPP